MKRRGAEKRRGKALKVLIDVNQLGRLFIWQYFPKLTCGPVTANFNSNSRSNHEDTVKLRVKNEMRPIASELEAAYFNHSLISPLLLPSDAPREPMPAMTVKSETMTKGERMHSESYRRLFGEH